ncbi:ArsR family transcriptional regulator [Halomarina oriensis]|uniref:ArsR family transcriptional regulator n=1 Tax=Halomarina oriensis TaxID=671145 RepID=UPI001303EACE|nr:ArsR family transcriptional regulator [Halomarina oriensis]
MKLVVPTDFEILEEMKDGKRFTATFLAEILDKKSKYMNNRLAALAGAGYVEKVGETGNSGMYVVTPVGIAALEHKDEYSHDEAREFLKSAETWAESTDSDSDCLHDRSGSSPA